MDFILQFFTNKIFFDKIINKKGFLFHIKLNIIYASLINKYFVKLSIPLIF